MAWAGRDWIGLRLLAVLLLGAGAAAGAQTAELAAAEGPNTANKTIATAGATGSIAGRLTDLHSAPLAGATVVVRNAATGEETRTITARNGSYRFGGLAAGEYTLDAESPQLGHGWLEGIYVSGGHEARVQAAMEFEPAVAQPLEVAAHEAAPAAAPSARTAQAMAVPPAAVAKQAVEVPAAGTANGASLAGPIDSAKVEKSPATVNPLQDLQDLARVERPAAEGTREQPATVAAVSAEPLAVGPLLALPLRGWPFGSAVRAMPETAAQELLASVAAEPLQMLNLSGYEVAGAGVANPAVGRVGAASERVDPAAAAVTTTMTAAELQALPAAGRRWQDFVLDTPTASTAAGGTSQASLRGAGQEPMETSIDGTSTRMAFGGQGSSGPGSSGPGSSGMGTNGQGGSEQNGMGQAWAGGRGSPVAEAAIREVQTVAGNVEADGARTAGGRIEVETVRGTNGLHGQGFLFDKQSAWGAQNPFTQWVTETGSTAPLAGYNDVLFPVFDNFKDSPGQYGPPESYTPPDHEMVWGVGLGSQIRRDKLFWFGALDSYRRNDPAVAMVKWPYAWQIPSCEAYLPCPPPPTLGGLFAPPSDDEAQVLSARLGLSSVNPVAEGLTAYSPMLEALAGLLGPAPRTAAQWVGFGRLDWQAAERHRFTLEGIGARWNSPGGGLTGLSENYGNHSFGLSEASEEWLLGRWEAFMTPNLLAVTQVSEGRNILEARPSTPSGFEQTFLGPNVYGQLPQIVVDNRYGFTIGNPSRFGQGSYPDEHLYHGQESVDWIRGNLLVKAGFEVSHNADATSLLRNQTGTYTYSNVENFISDALVFQHPLPHSYPLDPDKQQNCDETGKVWRDSGGGLRGLGNLPCYSYYSQTIGPTDWHLSTNDWAAFWTAQWQPKKLLVVSGGLRWEREQLPPPIASVWPPPAAPNLPPGTLPPQGLPSLGNDWGPRVGLAFGSLESHWPLLRLGYGMYFGRTQNSTVETALTQTGSLNGDLKFFMRPTDDCQDCAGGAPPFPYVLTGPPGSVVKPGAVEFTPNFRNPEVHQAVAAVEEELPGHVEVTASALVSLGRRLPVYIDTNLDTNLADAGSITYDVCDETAPAPNSGACGNLGLGPIKAKKITVPFYASWPSASESTGNCPTPFIGWLNPCYQGIDQITSKANSTYEAAVLRVERYGRGGLSLHAHYTYSHAMDWNPGESPLDPNTADYSQEYGTSDQDMRHSAAAMVVYEAPWKLRHLAGKLANGWMVSGIGQFHSGLPYTMRVSGSLPECGEYAGSCTPPSSGVNVAPGNPIVGLRPGMIGSGGDNRVYWESDGRTQTIGRNTFRYPATWKADLRVGKKFDLGKMREVELLAESFNLFNHQNVTEVETTGYFIESGTASSPPTLNFLTGLKINATTGLPNPAFGQPLNINATNFYRPREIQVGVRMRF